MSQDTTVNAGEIARLVDVGRAAVSNWRRRYEDFPQPVGGTASSPLFSLAEVEDWLRRNGKSFEVSLADRVWQQLRASDDDLRLGHVVAWAGELLLALREGRSEVAGELAGEVDGELASAIGELAGELGHRGAFEALCDRYLVAHSRQLTVTAPQIAELIAGVVGERGVVLDPACGLGGLLLAVGGARVLGQDVSEVSARIASVRMRLAGLADSAIVAGDSLREDGFEGELADAVVCEPPFNERAWGYAELTSDPRWVYGLPPRGESELAWVQHCLARVRVGGVVAILMPSAAAGRRPGKRIRGNLLRAGALRAVLTLAEGGPDLWLLRRPEVDERPAMRILLGMLDGEFAGVVGGWERFLRGDELDGAELFTVPVLELLDDDVDVSPGRHRALLNGKDLGAEYAAALAGLRDVPVVAPPELVFSGERRVLPTTTVGELIKAGVITVRHASGKVGLGDGDVAVLTIDDLAAGRSATGRTVDAPDLVRLQVGDVVAAPMGLARVVQVDGVALGPYLSVYRVDREHLDPDFLAGFLRAADQSSATGSSRIDARRTVVPRLALAEQQHYAAVFRQLIGLQDAVARTAEQASTLVRLGFAGLVDGHLRPKGL